MTEATTPNPNDPPADTTALGTAATEGNPPVADPQEGGDPPVDAPVDPAAPKDGDPPAAPEGAPEAYDTAAFTMPEGITFDEEGFKEVEPVLRDLNLTQEQAGKLMGAYGEKIVPLIAKRTTEQFDEQGAQIRADLARDLQADSEVGGKKLDESRSYAAKAISHFIPNATERAEFSEYLNASGLGNHPLLMRIIAGSGRTISEASTPAPGSTSEPLSNSQLFYGKKG